MESTSQVFEGITDKVEEKFSSDQPEKTQESNSEASKSESAQAILELDKVKEFLFEGQKFTPQELKNAWLRQQDYTRKTQELARERESVREVQREKQY